MVSGCSRTLLFEQPRVVHNTMKSTEGSEDQWRLVVFFAGGARLQKTGCGRKYRWEPHPKSDIG